MSEITAHNIITASIDNNLIRFRSYEDRSFVSLKKIAKLLDCAPCDLDLDSYGLPIDDDGDLDLENGYTINAATNFINNLERIITDLKAKNILARRQAWVDRYTDEAIRHAACQYADGI